MRTYAQDTPASTPQHESVCNAPGERDNTSHAHTNTHIRTNIQRYTDTKVYEYEDKVNGFSSGSGTKYRTKYLSKSKTLRYFQSDTYDNEIKNGKSEKEAFILAREVGDWNWKEDSAGRIWYDRRFKKDRLT